MGGKSQPWRITSPDIMKFRFSILSARSRYGGIMGKSQPWRITSPDIMKFRFSILSPRSRYGEIMGKSQPWRITSPDINVHYHIQYEAQKQHRGDIVLSSSH